MGKMLFLRFHCLLPILTLLFSLVEMDVTYSQLIKVMSYNIRLDTPHDSLNNWLYRKEAMIELFKKEQLSVMGLQEVLSNQLLYIDQELTSFRYIGVGRDDGDVQGEFCPIFIDSTIWNIDNSSTFWLSETPYKVSVGWDAALPRICTYALLEHQVSNRKVWVFNTHFDHVGVLARQHSVSLIENFIDSINVDDYPVILMGDFNLEPHSSPIQKLSEKFIDTWKATPQIKRGVPGTFNGFGTVKNEPRIDYIFSQGLDQVTSKHLKAIKENGRFISDHFPILSTFYLLR